MHSYAERINLLPTYSGEHYGRNDTGQVLPAVYNFVEICFQFRYGLFKTGRYHKDRKAAEAEPFFAKPFSTSLLFYSQKQKAVP